MGRYLTILIAVIWMAATGAFFWYVPLLPVIGVALISVGLVLMFVLGVHVGAVADSAARAVAEPEILSVPGTNCAKATLPQNASR